MSGDIRAFLPSLATLPRLAGGVGIPARATLGPPTRRCPVVGGPMPRAALPLAVAFRPFLSQECLGRSRRGLPSQEACLLGRPFTPAGRLRTLRDGADDDRSTPRPAPPLG